MTYAQKDNSISDGSPVELYKFVGELGNYYYTNDNVSHSYGGKDYIPTNIIRSAIDVTSVLDSIVTVDVTFPITNEIIQLYNFRTMPIRLSVEIFRFHRGDDIDTQSKRIWFGEAVSFPVNGEYGSISTQSSLQAYLTLATNQIVCHTQCNHKLYDARCKINPDDFKWSATVQIIRGVKIIVDDDHNPDGALKLGKIVNDRTGEYRIITDNKSNVISLTYEFIDIKIGDTVTLFTGCDRSYTTCRTKFDNVDNFGGLSWLPSQGYNV